MALNTDYALRTGAFEPETGTTQDGSLSELQKMAQERYDKVKVCNNFVFFVRHWVKCRLIQFILLAFYNTANQCFNEF